ncbi:MAG: protein adenylyltransferase SelO [Burkholderiales bacterium]
MSDTQTPPSPPDLHFSNRFANLGSTFYTELLAQGLPNPHWVATSPECANLLGWPVDWTSSSGALEVFSGAAVWPGMRPLASVYSGHQFGHWAGQLGDGRALYLGEVHTPHGPLELQLKGSGLTPYSRMGDGRAVLRSSIREFLCSEAMAGLGIPTTRALCITGSALPVRRETMETAAVVTRVASSFIRFGHFEHFSYSEPQEHPHVELKQLADFVIEHFYPDCTAAPNPYAAMLQEVVHRTASLMAQWQAVGFCHGVMNTDNMSILGLTLDYGPFGFLDAYVPGHICNHSDTQGRYAYNQQPQIALWNLYALGQALLPLIGDSDQAIAALETYKTDFPAAMQKQWRAKLGLQTQRPEDQALAEDWLALLAQNRVDFTLAWRLLAQFNSETAATGTLQDHFLDRTRLAAWAQQYATRLQQENSVDTERALRMNAHNSRYVLRNHLAEVAIRQAVAGDFSEINRLRQVLAQPYDEQPYAAAYAALPPDWAQQIEVSCSS